MQDENNVVNNIDASQAQEQNAEQNATVAEEVNIETPNQEAIEGQDVDVTPEPETTTEGDAEPQPQEPEGETATQEQTAEPQSQEPALTDEETLEAQRLYKKLKQDKEAFMREEVLKDAEAIKVMEQEFKIKQEEQLAEQRINESIKIIQESEEKISKMFSEVYTPSQLASFVKGYTERLTENQLLLKTLDPETDFAKIAKCEGEIARDQQDLNDIEECLLEYKKRDEAQAIYKQSFQQKQEAEVKRQQAIATEEVRKSPVFKEIGVSFDDVSKMIYETAKTISNGNAEQYNAFSSVYSLQIGNIYSDATLSTQQKAQRIKEILVGINPKYRETLYGKQKEVLQRVTQQVLQKNQTKPINSSPKAGGVEGRVYDITAKMNVYKNR